MIRVIKYLALVAFYLVLFSCKSALNIKETKLLSLSPLEKTASVVVFNEGKEIPDSISRVKIGDFKIRDGGFTTDCGFETILNIAKNKSREVGGNVIKITRHILPGFSSCHQIDFEIYKIDDVTPFEKQILWSENRLLNWKDFKDAPKISLPFYCCLFIDAYFDFTKILSDKGKFVVNSEFNTECSWVQPDYNDKKGLDLANIHFGLTELYAIKLRKAFVEKQVDNFTNWQKFAKDIYKEVNREYETEVYNLYKESSYGNNAIQLNAWKFKISEALKEVD